MKNKYKLEGLGKNKKILKERKKPLPIELFFPNKEFLEDRDRYLEKLGENLGNEFTP